ncbi:SulP family inorganic anion transporter [Halofilum ochraceum]|uniref:SulP family inorganic anion transporter n=1 Tax=Halofilum ochraceum TaxID=1611323 RepID=UPI001FE0B632|nr:sulfate permease [Halofilum ochraceum]
MNRFAMFRPGLLDALVGYDRRSALADLTAGTITAILLVPQGMAYALLAGLPAQYGLYAAIVPPAMYAVFGTSRTLAVGPVAVAALMVADALGGYAGDQAAWIEGAIVLAAEVGLLLLVAGMLGLGRLVAFVSHPVLSGFTSAAALLILLTQFGDLLGIDLPRGTAPTIVDAVIARIGRIDPATAFTALAAIAALLLARKPLRRGLELLGVPAATAMLLTRVAPLVIVIAATAGVALLANGAPPVATVGAIPPGLPTPSLDFLGSTAWLELLPSATLIALIAYVESVTVAQVLAARSRERIDPKRELVALGMANLGSAVAGTMPAAGGFSRSMVNHDAGARTQIAALVTAALVAVVALWFTQWFATLPRAVLAAIIVVAVIQLIDLREAVAIARYDRGDGATLGITFAGVLVFGIEPGLVAGIVTSLLLYVWRTSRPHMAIVGRVPGTEHFRNVLRHPVEQHPGIVIVRVDENIYFANTEAIRRFVFDAIDRAGTPHSLVLAMTSVSYVDSSGLALLERLEEDLATRGVALHLAEVKGPVADRLIRVDALASLFAERVHLSLERAVCETTGVAPEQQANEA